MGMFDSVRVFRELPADGALAGLKVSWEGKIFQTKDLENALGYYEITLDGKLRRSRSSNWWGDDEGENVVADGDNEDWEYIDHHGKVRFYASYCDQPELRWNYSRGADQMSWTEIMAVEGYDWWIEFEATFDNGILRGITMLPPDKTTIRARLTNNKEWAERREEKERRLCARGAIALRKIPGWSKFLRQVIKFESEVHSKLSGMLSRMA